VTVATIYLDGKEYERAYELRYCQLPDCGQRIQFRLDAKGRPESADKYNKRKTCCKKHEKELARLTMTAGVTKLEDLNPIDKWFRRKLIT
jgi:hypothetical protein